MNDIPLRTPLQERVMRQGGREAGRQGGGLLCRFGAGKRNILFSLLEFFIEA